MKKQFAIRGLIILLVCVALCMFMARTVQSITTPKVKLIKAQSGKLEQKTALKAQVIFPSSEPYTLTEAMLHNAVVQKVYVKPGFPVTKNELLFTCILPDYEKNQKELRDKYEEKSAELVALDTENRKRKKESERNARYQNLLTAQETLSEARIQSRALAAKNGIELPAEMDQWAKIANADEELASAIDAALAARIAYDEAVQAFNETYTKSRLSVNSEVYDYILKREKIIAEMDEIEAERTALEAANLMLSEVRAPRDGFIAEMGVSEGDTYDGKKAAYSMDDPLSPPVLRADAEGLKKAVETGSRATVKGEYDEQNTTVTGSGIDKDGKRYVDLDLSDQLLSARGGLYAMMSQNSFDVVLTFRAAETTTLVSASAVRTDDTGDYVYLVVRTGGGLMGESLKLRKQNVTVLDKSDKLVSISEDLSMESLADKEDRALEDEMRVMEYIR